MLIAGPINIRPYIPQQRLAALQCLSRNKLHFFTFIHAHGFIFTPMSRDGLAVVRESPGFSFDLVW